MRTDILPHGDKWPGHPGMTPGNAVKNIPLCSPHHWLQPHRLASSACGSQTAVQLPGVTSGCGNVLEAERWPVPGTLLSRSSSLASAQQDILSLLGPRGHRSHCSQLPSRSRDLIIWALWVTAHSEGRGLGRDSHPLPMPPPSPSPFCSFCLHSFIPSSNEHLLCVKCHVNPAR